MTEEEVDAILGRENRWYLLFNSRAYAIPWTDWEEFQLGMDKENRWLPSERSIYYFEERDRSRLIPGDAIAIHFGRNNKVMSKRFEHRWIWVRERTQGRIQQIQAEFRHWCRW